MKQKYASVFTLWTLGYIIGGASIIALAYGFIKNCDQSLSCQLETVFWQTTGFLGLFLGAVLIVFGYSLKNKINLKDDENFL